MAKRHGKMHYKEGGMTNGPFECQVEVVGQKLEVTYKDAEGEVVYSGDSTAKDHYWLEAPSRAGQATLLFEDKDLLKGDYIEEGYEGTWCIKLDPEETIEKIKPML